MYFQWEIYACMNKYILNLHEYTNKNVQRGNFVSPQRRTRLLAFSMRGEKPRYRNVTNNIPIRNIRHNLIVIEFNTVLPLLGIYC